MDRRKICEAMYALPGGVVVRHRKPVSIPAALLAIGVAMIVTNNLYGAEWSNDMRSALVFSGGALSLAGLILTAVRLFGSEGAPYHSGVRRYLRYEELYFDPGARQEVVRCVADGDVKGLLERTHAGVPAIAVAVYRTPDNAFAAMQAFEYADLEYRPLSELRIVERK